MIMLIYEYYVECWLMLRVCNLW